MHGAIKPLSNRLQRRILPHSDARQSSALIRVDLKRPRLAFVVGLWIRPAAALALFLVLHFDFGTSALYAREFLRDGTGPPVLAALVALVIGGRSLPFTIRR